MNGKPTVVSLFAGTGGSSLGYKWAGFKELLAVDFDSHAVECFRKNFPGVPVLEKSVTDLSGSDILKIIKLKKGELSVLDGSPPCQGFSTAGKRQLNDGRNSLFADFWRLVCEIRPKVFVMENVAGMAKGKYRGAFNTILSTLKSGEYDIGVKLLNSMYYSVPQSRERVIFIGVRKDLKKEPIFPKPHKSIVTVGDALKTVKELRTPPPHKKKWETGFKFIPPGGNAKDDVPRFLLGQLAPRLVKGKHNFPGTRRLDFIDVSPTITKTFISWSEPCIHPVEHRYLYVSELAALCSFPWDWELGENYIDAYSRLGNAVMPRFMQAIAETIKKDILNA